MYFKLFSRKGYDENKINLNPEIPGIREDLGASSWPGKISGFLF